MQEIDKKKPIVDTGDVKIDLLMPVLYKKWLLLPFEETLEKHSISFCKLKKHKISSTGRLPVIDQGAEFISGYTNDLSKAYKGNIPLIIFGDHTQNIKYVDIEFAVGADGTKILHPKAIYGIRFYYHYLCSLNFLSAGYSRHYKYLKQIFVPLPPFNEQKRIAAKLDHIMPKIDGVKERLERIPKIIKRFRQSVLNAAVTGMLTEKWREENPEVESAEKELLDFQEYRKNKKEKFTIDGKEKYLQYKSPSLPNLNYWKNDIPENWIVSSVSCFAECLDSLRVPVKKDKRAKANGTYPYFGANGLVDTVDNYIFDDVLTLVTEDETFYGRDKPIAYVSKGKCWVNNHAHVLRCSNPYSTIYLSYCLSYYDVFPWLSGATGRAKLTQNALCELPIGIPPIEEQKEIVRQVDKLFAFADKLDDHYKKAKGKVAKFPQSVLAKAFRGELVPQDPNDEPAEKLLERIQEEKAKMEAELKKTKKNVGGRKKAK